MVKNYIVAVKREYEFDLQTTEFEFKDLKPDMCEIQTELRCVIDTGLRIADMLTQLGLREVVIEAASTLLESELRSKISLEQINTRAYCFDKLLDWFTHVVLRFLTYLISPGQEYIWRQKI